MNIRNQLAFGGGFSIERDLSLKYGALSGLNITEEKAGLDAKITKVPVLNFKTSTGDLGSYIRRIDNGSFDIYGLVSISLSIWIKTNSDIVTRQYVAGKGIDSSVVGKYGIYIENSYLYAEIQDNASLKTIQSANTITGNTWYHLVITARRSDMFAFYIDKVLQSTAVSVGTFAQLNNYYEFCIGGQNITGGAGFNTPFLGHAHSARFFNSIISSAAIEACYNGDVVGSELGYWPMLDVNQIGNTQLFYDAAGNGSHLSNGQGTLLASQWEYLETDNHYFQKIGYSVYHRFNPSIKAYQYALIPYRKTGVPLSVGAPTNYVKIKDVPGSLTKFNWNPCVIDFNPTSSNDPRLSIFDRSNTSIHNAASRSSAFYNALKPYEFHSDELSIDYLKDYFTEQHKWRIFPSSAGTSVNKTSRSLLNNLYVYNLPKTTAVKNKVLEATGDKDQFFKFDYYFENRHISAHRDNITLFCNDAGILSISSDNGTTIDRMLDVSSQLTIVTFAHIFANGNILFCGQRKAYLSTDSLLTYSEIAVKDHLGNAFPQTSNGVFRSTGYREGYIDGKETLIWGCYGTESGTEYNNINVWFTNDNGTTLRSIYKFGISEPLLSARHIHGVWINTYDDSFLMSTGDGANECHWIKIVVNNDVPTLTWLGTDNGDANTFRKTTGSIYFNGYLYFGVDTYLSPNYGIWRAQINDILNTSLYEQMINTFESIAFSSDGDGAMVSAADGNGNRYVYASCNGRDWKAFPCTGGQTMNTTFPYIINTSNVDARGYFRMDQVTLGETYPDFTAGQVLMVRVTKNE